MVLSLLLDIFPEFVTDQFGEQEWNRVDEEDRFHCSDTSVMFSNAGALLGVDESELGKAFVSYFMNHPDLNPCISQALKACGNHLLDVVARFNDLQLHLSCPDTLGQIPDVWVENAQPASFEMHYQVEGRVYPSVWVEFLLEELAARFLEGPQRVSVTWSRGKVDDSADHEVYLIKRAPLCKASFMEPENARTQRLSNCSYGLTAAEFSGLFSFHLILDEGCRVVQAGDALQRLYPSLMPLDEKVVLAADFFQIASVPEGESKWDLNWLLRHQGHSSLILQSMQGLQLKGRFIPLERPARQNSANSSLVHSSESESVSPATQRLGLFIGAPWVSDLSGLKANGLVLGDFCPGDLAFDWLLRSERMQAELTVMEATNEELKNENNMLLKELMSFQQVHVHDPEIKEVDEFHAAVNEDAGLYGMDMEVPAARALRLMERFLTGEPVTMLDVENVRQALLMHQGDYSQSQPLSFKARHLDEYTGGDEEVNQSLMDLLAPRRCSVYNLGLLETVPEPSDNGSGVEFNRQSQAVTLPVDGRDNSQDMVASRGVNPSLAGGSRQTSKEISTMQSSREMPALQMEDFHGKRQDGYTFIPCGFNNFQGLDRDAAQEGEDVGTHTSPPSSTKKKTKFMKKIKAKLTAFFKDPTPMATKSSPSNIPSGGNADRISGFQLFPRRSTGDDVLRSPLGKYSSPKRLQGMGPDNPMPRYQNRQRTMSAPLYPDNRPPPECLTDSGQNIRNDSGDGTSAPTNVHPPRAPILADYLGRSLHLPTSRHGARPLGPLVDAYSSGGHFKDLCDHKARLDMRRSITKDMTESNMRLYAKPQPREASSIMQAALVMARGSEDSEAGQDFVPKDLSSPLPKGQGFLTLPSVVNWQRAAKALPKLCASPSEEMAKVMSHVDEWQFDIFALERVSNGRPLSFLGFALIHRLGVASAIGLNMEKLANFLIHVENNYAPNPYHNRTHAADVLRNLHVIATRGGVLSMVCNQQSSGGSTSTNQLQLNVGRNNSGANATMSPRFENMIMGNISNSPRGSPPAPPAFQASSSTTTPPTTASSSQVPTPTPSKGSNTAAPASAYPNQLSRSISLLKAYFTAIIHDYEHRGVNNAFLIQREDSLALLYNDISPMENHHAAAAFALLKQKNLNFMEKAPQKLRESLRSQVIDMVLATDMKQHFATISSFNARFPSISTASQERHPSGISSPRSSHTPRIIGKASAPVPFTTTAATSRMRPARPWKSSFDGSNGSPMKATHFRPANESVPSNSLNKLPLAGVRNLALDSLDSSKTSDSQTYLDTNSNQHGLRRSRINSLSRTTVLPSATPLPTSRNSNPAWPSTTPFPTSSNSNPAWSCTAALLSTTPLPTSSNSTATCPSNNSLLSPTHLPTSTNSNPAWPSTAALLSTAPLPTSSNSNSAWPGSTAVPTANNSTITCPSTAFLRANAFPSQASSDSIALNPTPLLHIKARSMTNAEHVDTPARLSQLSQLSRALFTHSLAPNQEGSQSVENPIHRSGSCMIPQAGKRRTKTPVLNISCSNSQAMSEPVPSPRAFNDRNKSHSGMHSVAMDDEGVMLVWKMAIKCADLGHLCSPRHVHRKWVAQLEEEMFRQGDRERAAGMPISALMDRSKTGITRSQPGFFSVVAFPLYGGFVSVFPGATPLMSAARDNYESWQEKEGEHPPADTKESSAQVPLPNLPTEQS